MTLDELLDEVVINTGRTDLRLTKILSAVKAATLKAHQSDFYSKDIYETVVTATSRDYVHQIDYFSIFSNYRAFKYIRKIDFESGQPGDFLEVITPDEVLDQFKCIRTDVAYIAGRDLNVKSSTSIQKLTVGVYVNPLVTTDGFSSWIAEIFPYAIIYDACRRVFKMIGKDQEAADAAALWQEQMGILKTNAISDMGY